MLKVGCILSHKQYSLIGVVPFWVMLKFSVGNVLLQPGLSDCLLGYTSSLGLGLSGEKGGPNNA